MIEKILFEEDIDKHFVELQRLKLQYDTALELDGKETKSKLPILEDDFNSIETKVHRNIRLRTAKYYEISKAFREEKDPLKKKKIEAYRKLAQSAYNQRSQLNNLLEIIEPIK